MLQLKGLIKEFADRKLLNAVDLHIRPGDRIGLCGENGAGKSTLLKILCGRIGFDGGDLQAAKGTEFGYLPQEGLTHAGSTLLTEMRSAMAGLLQLEAELKRLEGQIGSDAREGDLARYAEVQELFERGGGYTMEAEIGRVLRGLGFSEGDLQRPCEQFSGGWQMRIALGKLLLQRPNLLLLDEPTNHLDLPARDWLEGYLRDYPFAVVMVSHDRFFLDQVVGRIVEVWNGSLHEYSGNYSRYLKQREERVTALREQKRRQDEEIERIEAFISRFRYQANKASLVQSRVKQLEKIERIAIPPQRRRIGFQFPPPPKGGKTVLELQGASQSYGELEVLRDVDLTVDQGERLALVGPNGAGKSTLMRLLAGAEQPVRGARIEGHNLVQAYFAQDQARELDPGRTVLEQMQSAAPFDMVPKVRNILGAFLFSGDEVEKQVKVLSGGERNRLALALLLLRPANLLLLDEPTNHLDLASKEVLLEALRGYGGTLIFVSHDRYFVDSLATRVLEIGAGKAVSWPGNYEDFLHAKEVRGDDSHSRLRVEQQQEVVRAVGGKDQRRQAHADRKAAQRAEQRRQKQLQQQELRIEELEEKIAELEQKMAAPDFYADQSEFNLALEQHRELKQGVEEAYAAWEKLQEPASEGRS